MLGISVFQAWGASWERVASQGPTDPGGVTDSDMPQIHNHLSYLRASPARGKRWLGPSLGMRPAKLLADN